MKREKRTLTLISLIFATSLHLCAQDQRSVETVQKLLPPHNTSESNVVVELPQISTPEVRASLENNIIKMQDAVRDAKAFVERKGAKREKDDFWYIEEKIVSEGKTIFRSVDFLSERGPMIMACKVVVDGDWKSGKEIRDQTYHLRFYPDGKVKNFSIRGSPQMDLWFYPSGGIREYYVTSGKVDIVSGRWNEDGSIKHFKHEKPKP